MNEILVLYENITLHYPLTHSIIKKFYDNKKMKILSFKKLKIF